MTYNPSKMTTWSIQQLEDYHDRFWPEWNKCWKRLEKIRSNPSTKDTFKILKDPTWLNGLASEVKIRGEQLIWIEDLIKTKKRNKT